ncbi:hypothetical protein NPIL_655361 [Nephila pilipes]|uniref:Uncharacterized protein n=1 Tax=Nephila pilipes TaxID=299642 RepID=A0A8X6M5A6_NEPPI|nr:hypothetical protein NPIL_655361 [Nephila pilipes]
MTRSVHNDLVRSNVNKNKYYQSRAVETDSNELTCVQRVRSEVTPRDTLAGAASTLIQKDTQLMTTVSVEGKNTFKMLPIKRRTNLIPTDSDAKKTEK